MDATPQLETQQSDIMADMMQGKSWLTAATGFARRVIRLFLSPAKEFARLADQPETVRDVFLGWILPLVSSMVSAPGQKLNDVAA